MKNDVEGNDGVVIAAQQADLDKPTARRKTTNVAGEVGLTDKVDDQIDTARGGRVDDFRLEVALSVIEDHICADCQYVFDVACRCRGQHGRARRLCKLD